MCGGLFLVGSLQVEEPLRRKSKDKCPLCGGYGPFRDPTKAELRTLVPESQQVLPFALILGVVVAVIVFWLWRSF